MALSDEKTVSVTTYRKSGSPVATATWIVSLADGKVGFWTSSKSGKAKRLRNDGRVLVQPSSQRGTVKPGTSPVEGVAEVVTSGPEFDDLQAKVKAKYGFMVPVSKVFNTLGHLGKAYPYGDVGVIITLNPPPAG
jgi:uncharacterized protein